MSAQIRVLCVDDEPRVLEGLERNLGEDFEIVTAEGGAAGIEALEACKDFDVVISDMRMPKMSGAEFLRHARALAPDAARVLLTGQSDAESAREAVNEGQIFRYLVKPCPVDELSRVIEAGAEARRRVLAERELLDTTVSGSIKLLVEVLHLTAPSYFREAPLVASMVEHMCTKLELHEPWRYRAAAMLHGLGYIALPTELVERRLSGAELTAAEQQEVLAVPEIGARLLAEVPRFREVAEMVRRHLEPPPPRLLDDIARGAAMIQVALAVLHDVTPVLRVAQIARALAATLPPVLRPLVELLQDFQALREEDAVVSVKIAELRPGMVLEEPLVTRSGNVLFAKGNALTLPLIERVHRFHQTAAVAEPVRVRLAG